jgi:Zinc knuckle
LHFFANFKRALELNGVPKEFWARLSPSVLNEKAAKIVNQLSLDECKQYDLVKSFLPEAFKATADTYLRRLNNSVRTGSESYRLFLSRLQEYQMYYLQCKSNDTFEALKDDCLLNIYVQSLPKEVAEFVKFRAVKTAVEAAVAADLCYSVQSKNGAPRRRQMSQGTNWPKQPGGKPVTSQGDSASVATSNAAVKNVRKEQVKTRGCWSCGSLGHKQTDCPDAKHSNVKKGKQNDRAQDNAFVMSQHKPESENRIVIPCYVQGRDGLITAYRDSGASISLETADIVDRHAYTGENIAVRGAFGSEIIRFRLQEFGLKRQNFGTTSS